MTEKQTSKYWLDREAVEITKRYPTGEIVVSSGVSPSGAYHIGHFREVLTADAITRALVAAGRKARHLHVVDNMDPLRKRYSFLPPEFEQYVGQPICLVPDPSGKCHRSYAAHYFSQFEASAKQMGVEMEVIFSYEDQYLPGHMTDQIEQALAAAATIRGVFEQLSNRPLPGEWTPVQVIGEDNHFFSARLQTWDKAAQTIEGVNYSTGRVKLNWRLDWPARWALHGVQIEPFGKEHSTKGGSYDTGREFALLVYKISPPYPIPYDTINLVGDNKKMSSSLGNVVTPDEALEIMPAEILRYFVLRSRPERVLYFDSGLGLYNLIEEYAKVETAVHSGQEHEFKEAYQLASAGAATATIASVPFSHLVAVYQAARGDFEAVISILKRTGYQTAVKAQKPVLERELAYVRHWLAKYAPDSVKFQVQEQLPKAELTDNQRAFLMRLADSVEQQANLDGRTMHDLIYACVQSAVIVPQEAFVALYRVILGKDSGPKAGWFLASLERPWLLKRLRLEA